MPKQLMQNCKYLADPIGYGERILRVGSKLNHPFRFQSGSDSLRGLICFNSTSSPQTVNLGKSELISISEVELVDGVIANLDRGFSENQALL